MTDRRDLGDLDFNNPDLLAKVRMGVGTPEERVANLESLAVAQHNLLMGIVEAVSNLYEVLIESAEDDDAPE